MMHGLALGGGRDVAMCRQVTQECLDFTLAQLTRVFPGFVEFDIPDDPLAVCLLRAVGVMVVAQHLPDLVQQSHVRIGPKFLFVFHILNGYLVFVSMYHPILVE